MTNVFFYHWFEDDFDFADKAENLVMELEDTMNKSLDLAVNKLSEPANFEARPKDAYVYKSHAKQIPSAGLGQSVNVGQESQTHQMTRHNDLATTLIYPSLEEKVVPAVISDYATNWVHISKFEDS